MPGFDGRGPMGLGPMTGGGRGFCNPAAYGAGVWCRRGLRPGSGRGLALGRGRGFGSGRVPDYRNAVMPPAYCPAGWNQHYTPNPQDEVAALRREAELLQRDLEAVNSRISELEAKAAQS